MRAVHPGFSSGRFPLAAVLQVTTGVPGLAPMEDVQALLSYMTGSTLLLHQLPRAADVCRKYLCDQYRWLEDLTPPAAHKDSVEKLGTWRRRVVEQRGETLCVRLLPGDAYSAMDPIREFLERFEGARQGAGLAGSDA